MNDTNTTATFPCKDAAADGCPNDTVAPDTHCADCCLFYEELAASQALLNDDSWKAVDDGVVIGFEVVTLPVEPAKVESKENKMNLDNVCYTMNAAEVDCQQALFQIADIFKNLSKSLNDLDNAIEIVESNCSQEVK